MRIEVDLTMEDFRAFTALIQRGGRRHGNKATRIRLALVWFGAVMLVAALHVVFGVDLQIDLFSAGVTAVFLIALLIVIVRPARDRAMPVEGGTVLGHHTYELSDDGIRTFSKYTESLVRWGGVRGLQETPTHLFVMIDRNAALMVPKRHIATQEDLESLKQLVRNRVEAAD